MPVAALATVIRAAVAAGGLLLLTGQGTAQTCSEGRTETATFESAGTTLPVEILRPANARPAPAVLLLHGRAGLPFYGERLRLLACALSAAGIVAAIPTYFDASAGPPPVTDASFQAWERVVGDALSFLSRLDGVDAGRIGIAGFSLGGYLGSVRAAHDPRIRALALHGAGLSSRFPKNVKRMPPVLILHAKQDPIVPVAEAEALAALLRDRNGAVGITLYGEREHILSGEPWRDAMRRMVGFFREWL